MSRDYKRIAAEWLRMLRGSRSQVAMSRWLGYRSNILHRWETAQCAPSASTVFTLLERQGTPVANALESFYGSRPAWLSELLAGKSTRRTRAREQALRANAQLAAALLNDLRGTTPITTLAHSAKQSRYAVTRWLKGSNQVSLPHFLQLVEVCSGRLLDFIACFTDPYLLPSLRKAWRQLNEARELGYRMPWTHAVVKVLSMPAYLKLPKHDAAWIGAQLGIELKSVKSCLEVLEQTGQLSWTGTHYQEHSPASVDTRVDPQRARELKRWWLQLSAERLDQGAPGLFAYNLSAIAKKDLVRLEELQRRHYRAMRRIISESEPAECIVLYGAQLLSLQRVSKPNA